MKKVEEIDLEKALEAAKGFGYWRKRDVILTFSRGYNESITGICHMTPYIGKKLTQNLTEAYNKVMRKK